MARDWSSDVCSSDLRLAWTGWTYSLSSSVANVQLYFNYYISE
jgi:hypothetical protein